MEVSTIAAAFGATGLASSAPRADDLRLGESRPVSESDKHRWHDGDRRHPGHPGRALGVFKQELRAALRAHFQMTFASPQPAYALAQTPATSADVAEETLGVARQLVAQSPTTAGDSLITFRAKVQETAYYVKESASGQNETADLDDAVFKIDQGLNELEDNVAANRESAASVLAVDTQSKQRSTIQIRTQEGDIVKLSLKQSDSLSAMDVAAAKDEMSVTTTAVELSSRSRMILKVEGDLNEAEMAAIANVFAAAERIADEFFGGDIGAAFNLADGFEFDTAELARVNMRFDSRQVTNLAYAQVSGTAAPSVSDEPAAAGQDIAAPAMDADPVVNGPEAGATSDSSSAAAVPVEDAVSDETPGAVTADSQNALSRFLDTLSAFLQSVGDGFPAEAGGSFIYHYSSSFKLSLLKSVINVVAPDDAAQAVSNAASVIDQVSE